MKSITYDIKSSFKASTKTSPAVREEVRKALAEAMAGVPVDVIEGFTAVQPMPLRKRP